jgi:hypothetical protein
MEKSKQAYKLAQKEKGEDRVTTKDIKMARKVIDANSVKKKMSGGMAIGGGKKNYKTTGMLGAKTGKLVGGQKNLPGHLQKAILA